MYSFNPLNNQLDISSVSPYQARYYGSFFSDQDQPNPDTAQANIVTLNNTVANFGVALQGGDTIKITNTGIYSITFSLQLENTHSQLHRFTVWLVNNGNIVPNTNSEVSVTSSHGGGPGHELCTVNLMDMFQAGDEVQLAWWSDDTRVSLQTLPVVPASPTTPERPASPSVIITVQEV